MTNRIQTIILGISLLLISLTWSWFVIKTIPPGYGDGEIGARIFPLTFGMLLGALALLMLFKELLTPKTQAEVNFSSDQLQNLPSNSLYWIPAIIVMLETILYGFLLEKIGFVLATPLVIVLVMVLSLKIRSIKKILIMSFGLTATCWIIFEKIFGIYLANGLWINLG